MIELRHLHRTFEVGGQPVHALVDANLEIPDGQYVSLGQPATVKAEADPDLANVKAVLSDEPQTLRASPALNALGEAGAVLVEERERVRGEVSAALLAPDGDFTLTPHQNTAWVGPQREHMSRTGQIVRSGSICNGGAHGLNPIRRRDPGWT